jgi:hypothetical protein
MRLAPGSASRRGVFVVLVILSRRFLLYICRWAIYLVFSDRDESWLLEELFVSVSSPLPGVGQVFKVSRSGCLRSCFCNRFGPSVVEIDISRIGSRSSIDWWYFQIIGVCFEF